MRFVIVVALLAGCGQDGKPDRNAEVCDHYAKLSRDCVEDVSDAERAQLEIMSRDFCRKGMSGRHEEMFGARYRAMIECTRTADTCESYRTCQSE